MTGRLRRFTDWAVLAATLLLLVLRVARVILPV